LIRLNLFVEMERIEDDTLLASEAFNNRK